MVEPVHYGPSCVDCTERLRELESCLHEANYRTQLAEDRYNLAKNLVSRLWRGDAEAALHLFSLYPTATNESSNGVPLPSSPTGYDRSVPQAIIQQNLFLQNSELFPDAFLRNEYSNDKTLTDSDSSMGVSATTRNGSLRTSTTGSSAYNREKISNSKVSLSTCSSPDLRIRYDNRRIPFGKLPSRVAKRPNAYMSLPVVNLTFPDPVPLRNNAFGRRPAFPSGSGLNLPSSPSATQQTLAYQFALPEHHGFQDGPLYDDFCGRDGQISSLEHLTDFRKAFDNISPTSGAIPALTDDSDMMKTLARIDADIREFRRRKD